MPTGRTPGDPLFLFARRPGSNAAPPSRDRPWRDHQPAATEPIRSRVVSVSPSTAEVGRPAVETTRVESIRARASQVKSIRRDIIVADACARDYKPPVMSVIRAHLSSSDGQSDASLHGVRQSQGAAHALRLSG